MGEKQKIVVFQMNHQHYGVPIQQVRSIERFQEITEIPYHSKYFKGVINFRNEVTPIIDLKKRLQGIETIPTNESRILLLLIQSIQIGIMVDSTKDVLDIDSTIIDPPPKIIERNDSPYIVGIAKLKERLLILINIKELFNFDEIQQFQKVVE